MDLAVEASADPMRKEIAAAETPALVDDGPHPRADPCALCELQWKNLLDLGLDLLKKLLAFIQRRFLGHLERAASHPSCMVAGPILLQLKSHHNRTMVRVQLGRGDASAHSKSPPVFPPHQKIIRL